MLRAAVRVSWISYYPCSFIFSEVKDILNYEAAKESQIFCGAAFTRAKYMKERKFEGFTHIIFIFFILSLEYIKGPQAKVIKGIPWGSCLGNYNFDLIVNVSFTQQRILF